MEFVEAGKRGVKVCLVEDFERSHKSPSTVKSVICRHSASKSSCEVPCDACVTTAPTSFSRCTDSMNMWSSGVRSHVARTYAVIPSAFNVVRSRWSIIEESGVIGNLAFRLAAALPREITDHVCAWAAASPARYRASSSSKAASISSRSNATAAANRPSALISKTISISATECA